MLTLLEWLTSIALTVVVVVLLFVRMQHAGGLWRDEAAAVQLAQLPSWLEVQQQFQYEAFPLVFPALLRGVTTLFGGSDATLRIYGFMIGLLLIVAFWANAWIINRKPPLISLSLIGLSPTVLTWAITIRGYGPACVLIALTFGLLLKLTEVTRWPWMAAAFLASFFSVQFALHNCFLLLVIGGTAIVISLVQSHWKSAGIVAGIGTLSALAMTPYLAGYESADWSVLVKVPMTWPALLQKFRNALSGGIPYLDIFWLALLGVSLASGGAKLITLRDRESFLSPSASRLHYGVLVLIAAPLAYLGFLKFLSYPTQPWYYLMLMTVLACSVDLILTSISPAAWTRVFRILLVLGTLVWLPPQDLAAAKVRQTNIDLIADSLEQQARADDLIVVTPWYMGISFQRSLDEPLRWTTLPALNDLNVHRYDLLQQAMVSESPLADVQSEIQSTLRAGGTLWLVGEIISPPIEGPPKLPPAPHPVTGWSDEPYRIGWTQQLTSYLARHGRNITQIEVPTPDPVSIFETATLWKVTGWRD